MHMRLAAITTLGAFSAITIMLGGCQSAEQHTWLVNDSGPAHLGMVATPASADASITGRSGSTGHSGAVSFGAGDALGYQLYMNYVHYVHATGDTNTMYATGHSPQSSQD